VSQPLRLSHVPPAGSEAPGWTVVEGRVGEAVGFVPTLTCFPRSWRSPPPAWSAGGELRSVSVESVAFAERFEARVAVDQEENWLLQLLSPDFIASLTATPQAGFGFEVHEGTVRCFVPGQLEGEDAERMRSDTQAVLERIRSEALESEGLGVRELGSGVPERIERVVGEVPFTALPADSRTASLPFRRYAARDPRVYLAALGGVIGAFGVVIAFLLEAGVDAIELIVDIVAWIGPKGTGIALGVVALAGWVLAIPGAIAVAARRYGRVAFAREYARARSLDLESPQSFHRRLMRVDLPAPAEFVMRGALGDGREGRLVLCRGRKRVLFEHFDAIVVQTAATIVSGSHGGLTYAAPGGQLAIWRSASADRAAPELDGFIERALALAGELEPASSSAPA
jgi:hypothetical protein